MPVLESLFAATLPKLPAHGLPPLLQLHGAQCLSPKLLLWFKAPFHPCAVSLDPQDGEVFPALSQRVAAGQGTVE